jgi:hypothetical protein
MLLKILLKILRINFWLFHLKGVTWNYTLVILFRKYSPLGEYQRRDPARAAKLHYSEVGAAFVHPVAHKGCFQFSKTKISHPSTVRAGRRHRKTLRMNDRGPRRLINCSFSVAGGATQESRKPHNGSCNLWFTEQTILATHATHSTA